MKKKIILAYSGGLDTSVILKWLQENYNAEVIAYTANIGQEIDKKKIIKSAKKLGVNKVIIENLKNIFVKEYVYPMIRGHAVYEGVYLLGTSIARPLIAKRQINIAKKYKAYAVSHGSTGKGNDQVRFELAYLSLNPFIKIIAPWREWNLSSRTMLIEYAEKNQISIPKDKKGEAPFSVDANLLHISAEGKVLEDPWVEPNELVFSRTKSPIEAKDSVTEITLTFHKGDPVELNSKKLSPAFLLSELNKLGGENGIGRIDIVENRFVGMKSRGIYETPGGTILYHMRKAIESITLDKGASHLKEELMPKYAELIYNGLWFSPERSMLQSAIDLSQQNVNGVVRAKLYKGNVIITGRRSPNSLYDEDLVTFEEGSINYDHSDAKGFIKLNALRLMMNKIKQN